MARLQYTWRKPLAEFIGTFALVFAGCGAITVADRFPGSVPQFAIPVVFGLVVAAMIYAVGHVSGAHLNPAVTAAFAISGHFPKREVLGYWIAQFTGAILAIAALAFLLPPGRHFGATIPHVPWPQALGWEIILTFFLMFVIVSVATDSRAVGMMAGAAIGATVTLDAYFGGPITGASMNPARSLAPALVEGRLDVLWIYFFGPMIGAIGAALLYTHFLDERPKAEISSSVKPSPSQEDSMKRTHLIFIGGFLGAGKTTLLKRAAYHLAKKGKSAGLITNDQAEHLVDTAYLRDEGFGVEEVSGGCFCCRFDDLLSSSERLVQEHDPDVILGEPVGSCTDVSATVIAPLKELHGDRFQLAPFSVLVEPGRLKQALGLGSESRFSENVRYIFEEQMEEAELLVITKTDMLAPGELDRLKQKLTERYPELEVMALSAMTDEGVEAWLDRLDALSHHPKREAQPRILHEIDYDRYADGEAELGWLNLTARIASPNQLDSHEFATSLLDRFRQEAIRKGTDVAHVKLTLTSGTNTLFANLVSVDQAPRVKDAPAQKVRDFELNLNARVPMDPKEMQTFALNAMKVAAGSDLAITVDAVQSLRPGRPVPTHRFRPEVGAKRSLGPYPTSVGQL